MRRLTLGLTVLRVVALGALLLLLLNPIRSRPANTSAPPLVLLDASLSMAGTNGPWRAALDSARLLATPRPAPGDTGSAAASGALGTIWRFGDGVTPFDTSPPDGGASRLGPALASAAARGGPIVVLTDGAIDDTAGLPRDLRARPRIVVLPRPSFFDAYVAALDGPHRVSAADTIRLRVVYGTAGADSGPAPKSGTLTVSSGGRRLAARDVALPDSGTLTTEVALPAARLAAGWSALDVRLDARGDSEPRDDARRFAVEVSGQPAVVVLAAPPDWESRFFATTLADVARVPVQVFVETEPGGSGRWRDGATLAPVAAEQVMRSAGRARLLALIGDPRRLAAYRRSGGLILWPLTPSRTGDWYVAPLPASPLAGALAGIAWDSLPPATALADVTVDSSRVVLLSVRLSRRGPPRPLAVMRDSAGARSITIAGTGLWRWGFRGGAPAEAYRGLMAAITDWLLGAGMPGAGRVEPVATEAANGMPLAWRWTDSGPPRPLSLVLESERGGERTERLRFDAQGRAELVLPPAAYRWRLPDGPEQGLVVVEQYSDEWRPARPTVASQAGEISYRRVDVGARDVWLFFVVALLAFATEWVWRRRQGLP